MTADIEADHPVASQSAKRALTDARRRHHHQQVIRVPFVVHEDQVDRLRTYVESLPKAHAVQFVGHLDDSFWIFGVWSYEARGAGLNDITWEAPRFVVFDRESTSTERLCDCPPEQWRSCRATR
jgi:hypothetical protein